MFITKEEYEKIKIKPYEPCPCGSGNKFKFCCYQKAREIKHERSKYEEYSPARLQHVWFEKWSEADHKLCLGFDNHNCEPLIKSAHAIQNNRILDRISLSGHIYGISHEVNKQKKPVPTLKKISRNKSSTFFGFCEYHDTELFAEIERKDYKNTLEQNYLFAFRAMAFEYHRKIRLLRFLQRSFLELPESLLDPYGVNLYRLTTLDVSDYKQDYDDFKDIYMKKNYKQIYTIYRELDFEVKFATCSAFTVREDLFGNVINDTYKDKTEEKMPSIFVNIYPKENGTNILLAYNLKDKNIYGEYFTQLEKLSNEEMISYLNFLVIENTEDVFFSPKLIEEMTSKDKKSLLDSFVSSMDPLVRMELELTGNYYKFNIFNPLHP